MRNSSCNRAARVATAGFLLFAGDQALAAERPDPMGVLLLRASGPGFAFPRSDRFATLLLTSSAASPFAAPARPSPDAARPPAKIVLAQAPPASARRRDPMSDMLLGAGVASSGGSPLRAAIRAQEPDPTSLVLLMVQLDDLTLTDGMAAYGSPDDPLIPVGEFSRLLELDIDVSPSEGRIIGRIGQAQRSLVVDLATGTARIGPMQVILAPQDVAATQTEIYVRASALAKLLPLRLAVSSQTLSMKITALELLPIQGRLQRQQRAGQTGPDPSANKALRIDSPYKLATPPSIDVALGLGAQTAHPQYPLRYDLRLGGDFLYSGLQAYVGSDESGRPNSARVLLERRSLNGDLLGPLHARDVGLGDVFTPALAIGPRSVGGRGLSISTVPLDQAYVFNRIDLRGELPLGDDVELYVNDVLRGTQNAAVQGRYEFLNVPLTQGVNIVRIVTYGPRGQRSEETRVINVSGGLLKPGQATFEFAAVQQNETLFHFRNQDDPFLLDRSLGKPRIIAAYSFGLTQYLTLTSGASIYSDQSGIQRNLFAGGLRTSIAGFATQFDVAGDNRGGRAGSVGVAGRVFGANALLRHSVYRGGLIDETNAEADFNRPLSRRTELTVDEAVKLGDRVIPLTFRAVQDNYLDGGRTTFGSARGSASAGPFLYSTGLEYNRTIRPGMTSQDLLRGYVEVSTFRNYQWQVRTQFNYDIVPDYRANLFSLTVDRALSRTWSLRFAANQTLEGPRGTELLASSITKTRYGDLALTGQYDTLNNAWTLGAQVNFGLGYNPQARRYELTSQGPGSGGSVLFHAFVDANGDGRYEAGERPVANVVLEGGERTVRTDKDGMAYLTGFGAAPTARLQVSVLEVENQSVKAPATTVEFSPRPGGVTDIDYPLRPTGEVFVSIALRRPDGKLVGLSATRIRLVAASGDVLEATTEFDGSADFQDAPAGAYRLELDPEQAARLRMRLVRPVTLTIGTDGAPNPDIKAQVEFAPRDEPAQPPAS